MKINKGSLNRNHNEIDFHTFQPYCKGEMQNNVFFLYWIAYLFVYLFWLKWKKEKKRKKRVKSFRLRESGYKVVNKFKGVSPSLFFFLSAPSKLQISLSMFY